MADPMPTNRFGFWIDVTDAATAREAVRMAGLPVLLIGASFGLSALSGVMAPDPQYLSAAALATAAAVLVVIAFAIRAGRAALVPVAVTFCTVVLVARIALLPTALAIVPILALLLCISGLRGWLWLRRHPDAGAAP